MKIAFFAGTMKPGHDGVTRVLFRLSDFLQAKQIDHIFFSPIIPPDDEQTIPMYKVPSVAIPIYDEYRLASPSQKYFSDRLAEFEPDILHINSPCTLGRAAIEYGKEHGIPVVATYHTHFASYAKYHHLQMLEQPAWLYFKHLYNKCDRIYVPSLPILEELLSHGIKNLEYLPHGVDTSLFHPSHYSDSWKNRHGIEKKYALLFVGRLVWEKDLHTLADTYSILEKKRNDIAFVLAGDGPIRNELEHQMPKAVFLGYTSGEDLSEAFASSDIFVFPSTTETFGNVTLEAMASGIPPVCANQGGASGFIKDGVTGLFAKPQDPADFAAKIETLLDAPEQRAQMASDAFIYAQEQTWESSFERLLISYGDILRTNDYFKHINESFKVLLHIQ